MPRRYAAAMARRIRDISRTVRSRHGRRRDERQQRGELMATPRAVVVPAVLNRETDSPVTRAGEVVAGAWALWAC
jgi:hypothetical protein